MRAWGCTRAASALNSNTGDGERRAAICFFLAVPAENQQPVLRDEVGIILFREIHAPHTRTGEPGFRGPSGAPFADVATMPERHLLRVACPRARPLCVPGRGHQLWDGLQNCRTTLRDRSEWNAREVSETGTRQNFADQVGPPCRAWDGRSIRCAGSWRAR